jgi:hypothetical protein
MKEYVLDEPLSEAFLKFLERFGTVRYLNQMKKPYFSFEKEHFINIKGFVGDDICRGAVQKGGPGPCYGFLPPPALLFAAGGGWCQDIEGNRRKYPG